LQAIQNQSKANPQEVMEAQPILSTVSGSNTKEFRRSLPREAALIFPRMISNSHHDLSYCLSTAAKPRRQQIRFTEIVLPG
jgi:hypothetical protein